MASAPARRRTLRYYAYALVRRSYWASSLLYGGARRALLPLIYRSRLVRVAGFTIKVHSVREYISRQLIDHGGYEQADLKVVCSLLHPGDDAIDAGANIGLHTLHMARAVGPHGRVFAFEPDPANLELLRFNLAANGMANVTVFPYALGASAGSASLFLCDQNKGYQSLANLVGTGRPITVAVRTVDELLNGIVPAGRIRLMKLDVEGAEPLVLQGMRDWPDQLFFEFVPGQLRAFGNDPEQFLQQLADAGFALYQVDGEHLRATTPAAMTELADSTGRDHNVLARRKKF
jgi:FkbM family methyltransferase